jgi:hypothetical protein
MSNLGGGAIILNLGVFLSAPENYCSNNIASVALTKIISFTTALRARSSKKNTIKQRSKNKEQQQLKYQQAPAGSKS